MPRYHRIDAWRGYSIPDTAVAGSSYTGEWSDSPAPAHRVKPELNDLRKFLKSKGIKSRIRGSKSSNVFMGKLWVTVNRKDFKKAGRLAEAWMKANEEDTSFIHDADIPQEKNISRMKDKKARQKLREI